jgi:dGTPase
VLKEYAKLASEYDASERERRHPSCPKRNDVRSPFERDRDRIIHCAAFRRLQGKTQIFGLGGSDFFRTRLTHSLEAAQIGKGLALFCGHANTELVEAACLAHDIGHPPFGHTGESVLKKLMRDYGGFESNAQNLRLLDKLEIRSARQRDPGLNISRATIDALLKYKTPYSKIDKSLPLEEWKFYYDDDGSLVDWACSNRSNPDKKSLECQIMNWADDIAYSTHDLEDAIKVGMIDSSKVSCKIETNVKNRIEKKSLTWYEAIWEDVYKKIKEMSAEHESEQQRKGKRRDLIAGLIHTFITTSSLKKRSRDSRFSRYEYCLRLEPKEELRCNILKALVWELVINDERVATLQRKAETLVKALFEEFTKFDYKDRTKEMYPADFREKLEAANDEATKKRIACDYISGMTDSYAVKIYSRLRESEVSSLMDII